MGRRSSNLIRASFSQPGAIPYPGRPPVDTYTARWRYQADMSPRLSTREKPAPRSSEAARVARTPLAQ